MTGTYPGGVTHFRVLGIDPDVGLDPNDPTAFPTGLTFVGTGAVGITMTPIVVPEPGFTILAMMAAFSVIAIRRRS